MASQKSKQKKSSSLEHRDRISGLTDDELGHVLSFLPTKEAAHAAELSRRWRHIFGSVHTISFEECEGERANDWDTWYFEALEKKSCSVKLLNDVNAALLCRRRCAGLPVPLRSLRFAFDSFHRWDEAAVDQWISCALPRRSGGGGQQELHLDMRFYLGTTCTCTDHNAAGGTDVDEDGGGAGSDSDSDTYSSGRYLIPQRILSCVALRTLCVTGCRLNLRRTSLTIDLPFLEMMHLAALGHSGKSIQQLISSCPRLVDLTLEALWNLKRVSVLDKCLRRFSLRCCHDLKSAHIDASELRCLDYRGAVPAGSLLSLHGSPAIIPSCTIDFCMPLSMKAQFVRFRCFLDRIPGVTHLRLRHQNLESRFFALMGFPAITSLTRLTLQGRIQTHHIDTVARVLEQTPNLEVLTLLIKESEEWDDDIAVPVSSFSLPCLKHRLREIVVENYEGLKPEKKLIKLLLCNALVLERLHVVFAKGIKANRLEVQMGKWGVTNSEKTFLET